MARLDCAINENVAVLMEDGAFALFFCPHPGVFDSSRVPAPASENLPSKAKIANGHGAARGGGGGWGGWSQLELTDALSYSESRENDLILSC